MAPGETSRRKRRSEDGFFIPPRKARRESRRTLFLLGGKFGERLIGSFRRYYPEALY